MYFQNTQKKRHEASEEMSATKETSAAKIDIFFIADSLPAHQLVSCLCLVLAFTQAEGGAIVYLNIESAYH